MRWCAVAAALLASLLAPAVSDAAFPGANGKIAFVRSGDIWTINPDGTGQVNLTNTAATETNPAWSPDGNRIAFESNASGQVEVYVMLADGSATTQVTNWEGPCCNHNVDPTWSPDGTKLAFYSEALGDALTIINVDGTGQTPIHFVDHAFGGAGLVDPEWSPDGSVIAFQDEGSGNCWWGISVVRPDGTGFAPLNSCRTLPKTDIRPGLPTRRASLSSATSTAAGSAAYA